MPQEEASFTYDSAERIAHTVKAYERGGVSSAQQGAGPRGGTKVAISNIRVSGVYDATRLQYPGKYQYATVDGGLALVWNDLTSETQDCWIDCDSGDVLIEDEIYTAILVYVDPEDVELPIFKTTASAKITGYITNIECVGGELVITRAT